MNGAHRLPQPEIPKSSPDLAEFLGGVSLFQDLKETPEALREFAGRSKIVHFKPNENIITEGDTGRDLYVLVEGQVSVHKSTPGGDNYKVAILNASQKLVFGEGGLIDADKRSATIESDTLTTCLVLHRDAFESIAKDHPQWALPVLRRIAQNTMGRLKKANEDMMLLYRALVSEIQG